MKVLLLSLRAYRKKIYGMVIEMKDHPDQDQDPRNDQFEFTSHDFCFSSNNSAMIGFRIATGNPAFG